MFLLENHNLDSKDNPQTLFWAVSATYILPYTSQHTEACMDEMPAQPEDSVHVHIPHCLNLLRWKSSSWI